jgi:signal transduction histidine kinase
VTTAPPPGATMRERLTDPRAVGLPLLGLLSVVVLLDALLALGVFGPASRGTGELGARLAVGLLEALILWTALVLGRFTWLRPRWSRRRPVVTIATVLLGAQVGYWTSVGILVDRGTIEPQLGIGIDPTVFLTAVTVVLLVLLSALAEHREATTELRATTRRLQAALDGGEAALRDERASLQLKVRDLLEVRLGTTSRRSSLLTPEGLRELAEQVLRPLSHQLADTTTGFEPRAIARTSTGGWREVLRALRPEPTIRPRLLALMMVVLTFRASAQPPEAGQVVRGDAAAPDLPVSTTPGLGLRVDVDWTSVAASLLLHLVTFLVMLYGGRALERALLLRRSTTDLRSRWILTLGALSGLSLVLFGTLRLVHLLPGFSPLPAIDVAALLGYVVPILLVSGAVSLLAGTEAALDTVRSEMVRINEELARALARINALLSHERRLFARRLHASVQAAVNAGSLVLERAIQDGDGEGDDVGAASVDAAVIDRVGGLIERSLRDLDGDGSEETPDLDTRLAAIASMWDELCDVHSDVEESLRSRLSQDPVATVTVGDLIAEACANAVVHGRAANVRIVLRMDGDAAARLTVRDDGSTTHPMRRDGLGTRTLETHCTTWELTRGELGTTLEATLPIR